MAEVLLPGLGQLAWRVSGILGSPTDEPIRADQHRTALAPIPN